MNNRKADGLVARWTKVDRSTQELGSIRYGHGALLMVKFKRYTFSYKRSTGNLVLQDTVERLFAKNLYADITRGLFLVRGENVLLLGEIVSHAERS